MRHWLNKLTDLTAINHNDTDLNEALTALSEELGFGLFAFFHINVGTSFAISNYDEAWQSLYFEKGFKNIDPVVTKAKTLLRAFSWSWDQDKRLLTKAQKEMYARSSDFGIRSGVTVPIRTANGSMSMFTLASRNDNTCVDRDIDAVAAAAAVGQLHARIAFLQTQPTSQEPVAFTPKETTYLRWSEAGKTVEEIAEIEGVKYNTVRINLENAKKRLGVYNITQLTSIAIRRKII